MRLSSQLRALFALYIVLLAALLIHHARGNRREAARARELTLLAERLQSVSTSQLARLADMRSTGEKFLVTHDRGYFEHFFDAAVDYGAELRRLAADPATLEERARAASLKTTWQREEAVLVRAADSIGLGVGAVEQILTEALDRLDEIETRTQQLAAATQSAMARELVEAEHAAESEERVSWIIAAAALVLSAILSLFLVRSIARPLARLAAGTREISEGRFGHRLAISGAVEFSEVARDFNTMAERLEELDRLKKDFVSTVSHDLKTPLSSMQETTDVLLDELPGSLTPKQRQLLALNRESGRRLAAMLAKLLDLSRLEAETGPVMELVDVASLVREVVERASTARGHGFTHGARGPDISLVAPAGRLLMRVDPVGIAQVLDNLIENAIKFSPPGATVRIALADIRSKGTVLLSVADEGPGVPDAEKARVFERFHQTTVGRAARSRGVGLGLAICRHIVAAHGGVIWVADHEPKGAVFCVLLPGPADVPVETAA
jgi:signal transduction histidine kinase